MTAPTPEVLSKAIVRGLRRALSGKAPRDDDRAAMINSDWHVWDGLNGHPTPLGRALIAKLDGGDGELVLLLAQASESCDTLRRGIGSIVTAYNVDMEHERDDTGPTIAEHWGGWKCTDRWKLGQVGQIHVEIRIALSGQVTVTTRDWSGTVGREVVASNVQAALKAAGIPQKPQRSAP